MHSIILSTPSLGPEAGGPAYSVSSLNKELLELGLRSNLFTNFPGSQRKNLSDSLQKKIETGVDIVHDNGLWTPFNKIVINVASNKGIPIIVSPRGMLAPWALNQKRLKKRIAWWLYQQRNFARAKAVHATSIIEMQNIRKAGINSPIAIIPNGIKLPLAEKVMVCQKPKRIALFLSRLHHGKGLINLVQAWNLIRPNGWKLIIAGPDVNGHRTSVEALIKQFNLGTEIQLTGPIVGKEKASFYRNADIFVLPTFSENFGVVIAEAMSYGLPIITTKGAPWSVIEKIDCGWWIDIGVKPLAEAIGCATSISDTQRLEMGLRGRLLVKRDYSWPNIALQMAEFYQWVLKGGCKPDFVFE